MRNHYLPELFLKIIFTLNIPAKCLSFFIQFEVIFKWQKIYLHPIVWVTGWCYMRNNAEVKWSEVKSLSRVQLFATPWTVAYQAPPSMGFFWARVLEWVVISFSRGSSQPRDRTQISCSVGRFFTIWATREVPRLTVLHCFSAWKPSNSSSLSCYPKITLSCELNFSLFFSSHCISNTSV